MFNLFKKNTPPPIMDKNRCLFNIERLMSDLSGGKYKDKWLIGYEHDPESILHELFEVNSLILESPGNFLHVGGPGSGRSWSCLSSLTLRASSNSQEDIYFFVDAAPTSPPGYNSECAEFIGFRPLSNAAFFRDNEFLDILYTELIQRRSVPSSERSELANIFVTIESFHILVNKMPYDCLPRLSELLAHGPNNQIYFICIAERSDLIPVGHMNFFKDIFFYKNIKHYPHCKFLKERPYLLKTLMNTDLDVGSFINLRGRLHRKPVLFKMDSSKVLGEYCKPLDYVFLSKDITTVAKIKNGLKSDTRKISSLLKF